MPLNRHSVKYTKPSNFRFSNRYCDYIIILVTIAKTESVAVLPTYQDHSITLHLPQVNVGSCLKIQLMEGNTPVVNLFKEEDIEHHRKQ